MEAVQRWIEYLATKTGSESTKRIYFYALQRYYKFAKKNPDQLIKERTRNLEAKTETTKRKHDELLQRFFNDLDKKASRSLSTTLFNAIKSFYKANYVDLRLPSPKGWTTHTDKIPTSDEIKKMVQLSDSPLQRAVILFSAQSGQRAGIITALTYGHVKEGLESGKSPLWMQVSGDIRNRTGERVNKHRQAYSFFIGHDTIEALRAYLDTRKGGGDKIDEDSLYSSLTEDTGGIRRTL